MPQRRIAHFEIVAPLGSGGMGAVYRASDSVLQRDVALKLIRHDRAGDARARARFLREYRAAAAINHPGVAAIYEAGELDDGQIWFASELVEGETLYARMSRGPLPTSEAIDLGLQLAEALAAAHARGVVHRDIKPSNLMVTPEGRLKILDFGLARLVMGPSVEETIDPASPMVTLTRAETALGTPAYMSPEQASGMIVDARTDVFSSGVVLYEMLAGRLAFAAETPQETLRRVLAEEPQPLVEIVPSLPADLIGVIARALSKDRARRFSSGEELARALRTVKEGLATGASLTAAQAIRRSRLPRRLAISASVTAVLLAAGALSWRFVSARLSFTSRDTLLVADVDNQTGDLVFDIALRAAIETDLQQSRYANLFDRNQVSQTLKLMRRDPSSRIDETVGRDICRYAGLKALLIPRILAVGEIFDLQVSLIDPGSGRPVDRVRVTARGREAVLVKGVDELTRNVRSRLGESLAAIEENDLPIAQATTSSWEALRDLSLGQSRWSEGRYKEAEALFERGLAEDPHFTSARGSLGLLLIQFLGEREKGKAMIRQALTEMEGLSQKEVLLLQAVGRQFVDLDLEGALKEYRLISDLYPDLMQPYNNGGTILRSLGRIDEALSMFEKAAAADPRSLFPLTNLYWTRLNDLRDPRAAETVAHRMLAVDPDSPMSINLLSWSYVAQCRFEEAVKEARRVLAIEPRHTYALPNLAHLLMRQARAKDAVPIYRQVLERHPADSVSRARSSVDLALALEASGDAAGAAKLLADVEEAFTRSHGDPPSKPGDLLVLAEMSAAGRKPERADSLLKKALAAEPDDASTIFAAAQVYGLLGRREEALALLKRALDGDFWDKYFALILPQFSSLQGDSRFLALFPGCADSGLREAGDPPRAAGSQ